MRIVNWAFLSMFLLGAAVQMNDPDPLLWIAVYLLAAGACLAFARGRLDWRFSAALALVTLVWSLTLLPVVVELRPPLAELVTDVGMYGPGVEEAREMGGLWIISAWLCALSLHSRRQRNRSAPRGAAPL